MVHRSTLAIVSIGLGLLLSVPEARAAAPAAPAAPSFKSVLADEMTQAERDIAGLMMKRSDLVGDKRAKIDLLIDLRIIRRTMIALVAESKPDTPEQAVGWLRLKQYTNASRGVEEAVSDAVWAPSATQKEAMAYLHKLSFSALDLKGARDLDDFGRSLAAALMNIANSTPVDFKALPSMRPKPIAVATGDTPQTDRPPTVAELAQQVQSLASISVPLRQQLLELAQAAGAEKSPGPLYNTLAQSLNLARGLQANTAVSAENRAAIEAQLAEGIALYSDPRTRDAGRSRIESLGTYRQVLTRIGRMGLTREQVQQLSQGLAWASAAGEPGLKLLSALEQYTDVATRWDALPRDKAMAPLKKPLDDLATQFTRQRGGFMQAAGRAAPPIEELQSNLEEMKRLCDVAEDLASMSGYIDTLNYYKPKPTGVLERKVIASANAVAAPVRSAARNDAEKFLNSVQALAGRARTLVTKPLSDIPAAVNQAWAGGKLEAFETRWKALVTEMATALAAGSVELDKAKLARLDTALAMGESLRQAAQLEAALPRTTALARWVDWSIEPQVLAAIVGSHRDALAAAFTGFAADSADAVDKWSKSAGRFTVLAALVQRDVAYAEQCQAMPIGLAGDLSRLATKLDGEAFSTERYASYAIGLWALYDRLGDTDAAEKVAASLTRRLARDLHLLVSVDDRVPRRRL